MKYQIERRADGKWHVAAIGEKLTVYWDTYSEAVKYLENRIQCDVDDGLEPSPDARFSTVRHYLGHLIGRRIIDLTQHDEDDWIETGKGFVMLLLEGGQWLKLVQPEAIQYSNTMCGQEEIRLHEGGDEDGLPETE